MEKQNIEGKTIVLYFSCGAASAVAAKILKEKYGENNTLRFVNNPIKNEDEDNRRFLKDVEKWLNIEVEIVTSPKYPEANITEVFDDRRYMSGVAGAPCTLELKKNARYFWEENNHHDYLVLGFTAEETSRFNQFKRTERDNILGVLIDEGITKDDCYQILLSAGIQLPRVYLLGYPNANCIGCVKASSPTYWNHVRRVHPFIFKERAEQSRRIGAKLVRCHPKYLNFCQIWQDGEWYDMRTKTCLHFTDKDGKRKLKTPRIYLDELPEDAVGGKMKSMKIECGIFCEEN